MSIKYSMKGAISTQMVIFPRWTVWVMFHNRRGHGLDILLQDKGTFDRPDIKLGIPVRPSHVIITSEGCANAGLLRDVSVHTPHSQTQTCCLAFLEDVLFDLDHVLGSARNAVIVHKLMRGDTLPNSGLSPRGKT